jgi:DNA modification methylase
MNKLSLKSADVALDAIALHPENVRQGDVGAISESLAKHGQYRPIVVQQSTGFILAGNHTYKAAAALGWKKISAVYVDVDDEQARRIMLIDNRLSDLASYDEDALVALLSELAKTAEGLDGTGYDGDDLDDLIAALDDTPPVKPDADAVPDKVRAICSVGDIWILGRHRLIVGDSTDPEVLSAVLEGKQAQAVWTDPPYNVAYSSKAGSIINDDMASAEFVLFLQSVFNAIAGVMAKGAPIYVAHADTERAAFTNAYLSAGLKLSGVLIWRKQSLVLGRSDYQWQHEPILYGWKEGAAHKFYGGRKRTTMAEADFDCITQVDDHTWHMAVGDRLLVVSGSDLTVQAYETTIVEMPKPKASDLHPTMKPVHLIIRHLLNSTRSGALVLDPFGGSGSTLMACEEVGRDARLVELDPHYADVICGRFQQATGIQPVHAVTGSKGDWLIS